MYIIIIEKGICLKTNLVPRVILKKQTSFSPSSYSEKMPWGQGYLKTVNNIRELIFHKISSLIVKII